MAPYPSLRLERHARLVVVRELDAGRFQSTFDRGELIRRWWRTRVVAFGFANGIRGHAGSANRERPASPAQQFARAPYLLAGDHLAIFSFALSLTPGASP